MTGRPPRPRLLLRLVPHRWRASVDRDLRDENARSGRRGWRATAWLAAQTVGIAAWIAGRAVAERWRGRRRGRPRLESVLLDMRHAMRAVARQPASTATIVVTLALGMAASTTVFAVFDHVLFRPVPGVRNPDGLATVYFQPADRHPTFHAAPRAALDALQSVGAFAALGAAAGAELVVLPSPGAEASLVRMEFVTGGYLEALGVRARAGRLLSDDDIASGRAVAVVSDDWWRRAFGRDPGVIGRSISINREPVVIVGVLADYRGWGALRIGTRDIWMPIDAPVARGAAVSTDSFSEMVGRLQSGVTPAVAEQRLRGPFAPYAADAGVQMSIGPLSDAPAVPVVYPGLYEVNQERTRGQIASAYPFALGAGALLLLLACANTSSLLLARTMRRAGELAVRNAIGASRWRLTRGLLIEAALIVALAAALSVMAARIFGGLVDGERLFSLGPALDAVTIDWRVLAFSGALCAATVLLFGLVPAVIASRPSRPGASATSMRVTRSTRRLRAALVCVQLALALTLLSGAAVLVRSLQNLRALDLGMNAASVMSFEITPMRLGYTGERRLGIVRDTLDQLRRTPGVEIAAAAAPSPFWRGMYPANIRSQPVEDAAEHRIATHTVSADFFRTLQIPLRAGRGFTEAEEARPASKGGVGVINESLARRLFGSEPAVGRQIYLSRAARGWQLDRTIQIVGVAGDTRSGVNLRETGQPVLYEPGLTSRGNAFFIRSTMPAGELAATVRAAVREVDPMLPLADLAPIDTVIDRLIPEERVLAMLVSIVAAIALVLGVSGVHAVVAHTVSERTREFGIRLALGGTPRAVAGRVLRGVLMLAGAGVACGLTIVAALSQLLASRVYGVSPTDPMTLAAMSAVLGVAALAGAWIPARRVLRVNPALTLR